MSDDAFLAEIATAPDDPAPYLIYSDALQLRGDPRGDLISIQHALETAAPEVAADLRRREATLIEENEDAWLGPLIDRHRTPLTGRCDHREDLTVRWRFGFLHAARAGTVTGAARCMPRRSTSFTCSRRNPGCHGSASTSA